MDAAKRLEKKAGVPSYSGAALRYFQVLGQNMSGFLEVAPPTDNLTWRTDRLHHYRFFFGPE